MTGNASNSLLNNLKVLYVEDEDFARNELSLFLKRRVGKLYTAINGEEALKAFLESKPDLVVTDLKMPVKGGLELIEEIRKTGSSCPVIVISALSDSETIIKTVDLGIVKYAIKPVNTNELLKHMEGLASEILKEQMGKTIIGGITVLDRESKQELEKKVKSDIANFLKSYTGKGPRDIQVFIKGNKIEAKAYEVLTLIEANLVAGKRNFGLVDYNRKLFYEENALALEKKLGETMEAGIKLTEIKPFSETNSDELIFSII